jgi:hypothetical protein
MKPMKINWLKKWRAQGDDLRTFLGEFVANLTRVESLVEINR